MPEQTTATVKAAALRPRDYIVSVTDRDAIVSGKRIIGTVGNNNAYPQVEVVVTKNSQARMTTSTGPIVLKRDADVVVIREVPTAAEQAAVIAQRQQEQEAALIGLLEGTIAAYEAAKEKFAEQMTSDNPEYHIGWRAPESLATARVFAQYAEAILSTLRSERFVGTLADAVEYHGMRAAQEALRWTKRATNQSTSAWSNIMDAAQAAACAEVATGEWLNGYGALTLDSKVYRMQDRLFNTDAN